MSNNFNNLKKIIKNINDNIQELNIKIKGYCFVNDSENEYDLYIKNNIENIKKDIEKLSSEIQLLNNNNNDNNKIIIKQNITNWFNFSDFYRYASNRIKSVYLFFYSK
jgi:hypothetical protein